MPRAMWRGTLSFGLVNIPVKLYRATTSGSGKSLSFHLLHQKCGTRIKNVRWCPHCDEAVEWHDLVKGFEVSRGRYVKVDPKELDEILPKEDFAAVSIDHFVDLPQIDPLFYDRSYYAAPEGSPRAYALLSQALLQSGRVALARVTLRTRSHLAVVRPHGGHLLITTMFFENEIVDAKEIPALPTREAHVDKRQLQAALQLIDSMAQKFDPSKYTDEYAAKVQALVEEKVSGGEVTAELAPAEEGGKVVDLLDALRRSVAQKQEAPARARQPQRPATKRRTHRKTG
jgi:DNA end-binding protein Ku